VPTLDEIHQLPPDEAAKVLQVGGFGLLDGSWPIIGDSPLWQRERWPIPAFIRKAEVGRIAWRVIYSDEDPSKVISEQHVPYDTSGLEPDRLSGHKAAEFHIAQLFGG
jgi:hypothetical protein